MRLVWTDAPGEALVEAVGERTALVLTTPGALARGTLDELLRGMDRQRIHVVSNVPSHPRLEWLVELARSVRETQAEVIVAVGGGSVIDTGKVVAAIWNVRNESADELARIVRAQNPAVVSPPAIIAVPTTAGTGSEVTRWGTVWDVSEGRKCSVAHPSLYPEAAILCARLCATMPPALVLSSALDALSHAMESVWNRNATPASDARARSAIAAITGALPAIVVQPGDARLAGTLQRAAVEAGLAIDVTATALAHSISYPLTLELNVPHGIACSVTLPAILELVAEQHPERARVIAAALGCADVIEAAPKLASWLAGIEFGTVLREWVASPADIDRVRGPFLTPGRADNSLVRADEAGARAIAKRAVSVALAGVTA